MKHLMLLAFAFAGVPMVFGEAVGSTTRLLDAAAQAGKMRSREIVEREAIETRLEECGSETENVVENRGSGTDGSGHSTRFIVITAAVTALVTATVTAYLLRPEELCLVFPDMEYFVPRGQGYLVPIGILPAPRGCAFGRPK